MLKLLSSNLWSEIEILATNAKRKQIAVAYISDDLRINLKKGDVLITNATKETISSGSTSKKLLSTAFNKKVEIYSLQNLHSKLFIFDDVLIIGSTNISSSSRNRLHEAGIITDDKELIKTAKKLFEKYKKQAEKIDKSSIKKISSIKVLRDFTKTVIPENSKRPSLLDLMRSDSYLLDDFAVMFYETVGTKLNNKTIRQIAKKKKILLPLNNRWDWYEEDFNSTPESLYNRFFTNKELKVISIEIEKENKKIIKFVDMKPEVLGYVNKLKIKNKRVINFLLEKRIPYKLNKREFLKELNYRLSNKKIQNLISNKPDLLTLREFTKILEIK